MIKYFDRNLYRMTQELLRANSMYLNRLRGKVRKFPAHTAYTHKNILFKIKIEKIYKFFNWFCSANMRW